MQRCGQTTHWYMKEIREIQNCIRLYSGLKNTVCLEKKEKTKQNKTTKKRKKERKKKSRSQQMLYHYANSIFKSIVYINVLDNI